MNNHFTERYFTLTPPKPPNQTHLDRNLFKVAIIPH